MAQMNEKLIRSVFAEMIKYRPALSKYMVVDDDEDGEEVDYRVLGDQVIKNFPWPIGVELRRLFSGSMRQLDRNRLDQIFKSIERIMQLVSFVMVSQAWKDAAKGTLKIPDGIKSDFQNRFGVLSMGTYTWLIRMLGKAYEEQGVAWFMDEMGEKLNKKFFGELDFWVPERNEIGHYQINLTDGEIEKRCVEYEEKLTTILEKLSFLAKYRMVSVKEINVNKPKNQVASFKHVIDLLNSSDSDFQAKEIEENTFAESRSVLLMRSIKTIDEYINLSPLVIDTNSETLDQKDKFDIKKDIFLYTKFRSDHIMYLGTEVTEKCDLRALSNYDTLVGEFKQMMEVFSS